MLDDYAWTICNWFLLTCEYNLPLLLFLFSNVELCLSIFNIAGTAFKIKEVHCSILDHFLTVEDAERWYILKQCLIDIYLSSKQLISVNVYVAGQTYKYLIFVILNLREFCNLVEAHPNKATLRGLSIFDSVYEDVMPCNALIAASHLFFCILFFKAGAILQVRDRDIGLSLSCPHAELLQFYVSKVCICTHVLNDTKLFYLSVPTVHQNKALDVAPNFTSLHK